MNKIKAFFLLLVLLVLAIFFLPLVMNNQMVVDVETIVGDVTQVILGQVLLVTFVLGCFVGFLVGFAPASVYYWKIRHIERKLKRTQSQND